MLNLISSERRANNVNESADISVIVPVFNAGAHLFPLLSSLLNQSAASLEVIAVDDGSTDDSLTVLREAARRDPRLVVLRQANGGCSVARNRGLKIARGRWIAFADADDYLMPDALKTWRRCADAAQLDLLFGNGFRFVERPDETAAPLLTRQPWGEVITGEEWIVRSVAVQEWRHYAWLQLVRRELIAQHQLSFIDGIAHQDIAWTLRLALIARRVGFAREPLYGYRTNPTSTQNDPSIATILLRARSYLCIIPQLAAAAARYPKRSPSRRALLCHANHEIKYFLKLIREKLHDRSRATGRTGAGISCAEPCAHNVLWRGERARVLARAVLLDHFAQVHGDRGLHQALQAWVIGLRQDACLAPIPALLAQPAKRLQSLQIELRHIGVPDHKGGGPISQRCAQLVIR